MRTVKRDVSDWCFWAWLLAVLAAAVIFGLRARGQTTRPAVWFHPQRNLATMADHAVQTVWGPEVENAGSMADAELAAKERVWLESVGQAGLRAVVKRPARLAPLPAHVAGVIFSSDEPNGKGILPAALLAERAELRKYGLPLHLSLAGDKILSANFDKPAEAQMYRDYAALADVCWVNFYSMNRNASRYPTTHTGDAVAKLLTVAGTTRVACWVECSDQKLLPPPPAPGVARGPTAAEMKATVDYAIAKGAADFGWFATSARGAYGWPASYWPLTAEQGLAVRQINLVFRPDPTADRLERIEKKLDLLLEDVRRLPLIRVP